MERGGSLRDAIAPLGWDRGESQLEGLLPAQHQTKVTHNAHSPFPSPPTPSPPLRPQAGSFRPPGRAALMDPMEMVASKPTRPLASLPTLPKTTRMASLVNSVHSQTTKAEGRPFPPAGPVLRQPPTPPGAVSPNIASLPGGLFLELLVFPHFFCMFVLWGGGREGGTC